MSHDNVGREAFDGWWRDHGQYIRAGGGDYEMCFAFAAWNAVVAAQQVQADAGAVGAGVDGIEQALTFDCATCGREGSDRAKRLYRAAAADAAPAASAPQDERGAPLPGKTQEDRMNLARTVYAISASKTEPRPERREWFDAGFKAGVADRAAQQVQTDAGAVAVAAQIDLQGLVVEPDDDDSNGVCVAFPDDEDDTRLDDLMDKLPLPGMPAFQTADFDGWGIVMRFETEDDARTAIDALLAQRDGGNGGNRG